MGHPRGHLMELLMDNLMDASMEEISTLWDTGYQKSTYSLIMAL